MATSDDFESRAWRAAGPIFLVTFGIILVTVVAVSMVFAALPAHVGAGLAVVAVTLLVLGLVWGSRQTRTDAVRSRG